MSLVETILDPIITDKEERYKFLGFMSDTIHDKKPRIYIVTGGAYTGKSTLGKLFDIALGEKNTTKISNDYNDYDEIFTRHIFYPYHYRFLDGKYKLIHVDLTFTKYDKIIILLRKLYYLLKDTKNCGSGYAKVNFLLIGRFDLSALTESMCDIRGYKEYFLCTHLENNIPKIREEVEGTSEEYKISDILEDNKDEICEEITSMIESLNGVNIKGIPSKK